MPNPGIKHVINTVSLPEPCSKHVINNVSLPEPCSKHVINTVSVQEKMWALYEEYSSEIKKLVQEDWVSFRGSLHQLEDLMISWSEKMRNEIKAQGEPTPMIVKIQKEVWVVKFI